MLLIFVGGVMNIAWIAGLAIIVLVEKIVPSPADKIVAGVLMVVGMVISFTDMAALSRRHVRRCSRESV